MKMMNFRAIDPAFTAQGKVGMSAGGRLEQEIWDEFAGRPEALRAEAEAVRQIVSTPALAARARAMETQDYDANEGGVVLRLHRRYERDRGLVDRKRKAVMLANGGKLACEACGFDFAAHYGARGEGFIEVHHRKPVHTIMPGEITRLSDLAVLCANCHRMAHRGGGVLSVEELRALVMAGSASTTLSS